MADDHSSDLTEPAELTKDAIEALDDVVDALMMCEDNDIPYDGLGTWEEMIERLRLELARRTEVVSFKTLTDQAIREGGAEDGKKRKRLVQMFKHMMEILQTGGDANQTDKGHQFVEKFLETEGTTSDIAGDCRKRIDDLRGGDCVILVSGESSAGKSSLLNLLLGEEILPSHTKSCTAVITVIKYSKTRSAKIVYNNGEVTDIPKLDEEGMELLHKTAFTEDAHLRMGHNIREVQVYLPLSFLQTGLVLADTPGIGENDFLEEYLIQYISNNQILGFMYIIMTDNAGGVQEDRLLNLLNVIMKQQKKADNVLRFEPKAALFVCNRCDMIKEEDRPTVKQNALERLTSCWPDLDPANVIFFSTYKAKRDVHAHPDYINFEYKQLLEGLKNLYFVAMDRRMRSSYKWIERVLHRTMHYLKSMVKRLDMSDRDLQEKSARSRQKLQALRNKSSEVLVQLKADVDANVKEICRDLREYLIKPQVKMRLTCFWSDDELPSTAAMEIQEEQNAVDWIKDRLEDALNNRFCGILEEWDKQEERIKKIEETMASNVRFRLNLFEEDIYEIEHEIQDDTSSLTASRGSIGRRGPSMRLSIPSGDMVYGMMDVKLPFKAAVKVGNPIHRVFKGRKAKQFLKDYNNNPNEVAEKRAKKRLEKLKSNSNGADELQPFVEMLMRRPYEYLQTLETKIPNFIEVNEELVLELEQTSATGRQQQSMYESLMTAVESLRRSLMEYGEGYIFVDDFKSDEVKIEEAHSDGTSLTKTFKVSDMVGESLTQSASPSVMAVPRGLWNVLYTGRLCQLTKESAISIRIYLPSSGVEHTFQEVAKLRCLIHQDVFLAEFMGIHHASTATPAYVYSGELRSVRRYLRSCSNPRDTVSRILVETLTGLQYLHSKGLVHMELTRDTVTVNLDGQVRMTGACLPREARVPDDAGNVVAEFVYLPPEVLRGELYITAADVYCFGLMLLELVLKEKIVFRTERAMSFKNFKDKVDPISMLRLDDPTIRLSDEARTLAKACVEPDSSRRLTVGSALATMKQLQGKAALSSSGPLAPSDVFRKSMKSKS